MENIREMLENGMSREQIIALVNVEATIYETEEEAGNKILNDAREILAATIVDYADALGIIDDDISDDEVEELINSIEDILIDLEKEVATVSKSAKEMDSFMNTAREKMAAASNNKKITDDEMIRAFIKSLK